MEQPRINLAEHGKQIVCDECQNETFIEVMYLYRISRIVTGASQDSVVPMPSFKCSSCGHINKEFTPKKSQNKEETISIK